MTMMRAPDSLFSTGSVPNGHWAECVAELQLTTEQVQHLFSIREAFCKRAAALRDQRRALIRASTQVLQLPDNLCSLCLVAPLHFAAVQCCSSVKNFGTLRSYQHGQQSEAAEGA